MPASLAEPERYSVPAPLALAMGAARPMFVDKTIAEIESGEVKVSKKLTIELLRLIKGLIGDVFEKAGAIDRLEHRIDKFGESIETLRNGLSGIETALNTAGSNLDDIEADLHEG